MNDDCIFCKIASGEIPAYKIYEDDKFLAFLDIFPLGEGHTLVIPKQHFRWVWDVDNADQYFAVSKKIANHFKEISGNELVMSVIVGEEIPHAHIQLIPNGDLFLDKLSEAVKDIKVKVESDKLKEIHDKYRIINE